MAFTFSAAGDWFEDARTPGGGLREAPHPFSAQGIVQ